MTNIHKIITQAENLGMLQVHDEIFGLACFIAALKPINVMEIGSWLGGTFYILTQLASGKKISVDLDAYGNLANGMENRNRMFKTWAKDVYTIIGISYSQKTYWDVTVALNGEKLDFLFIDGDHSYNGVKMDFELYSPLVKTGGWVAIHDIVDSELHKNGINGLKVEVPKFWKEITGNKLEINIGTNMGGIGLIQV